MHKSDSQLGFCTANIFVCWVIKAVSDSLYFYLPEWPFQNVPTYKSVEEGAEQREVCICHPKPCASVNAAQLYD